MIFVVVDQIKNMDASTAFSCMVQLNQLAVSWELVETLGPYWIGTTATGLFVLIPDDAHVVPHLFLGSLFDASSHVGVPIRCGVAWGPYLCFRDIDENLNFIGKAINTAARLANSSENPGSLLHEGYNEFARGFAGLGVQGELDGLPILIIRGKDHDQAGFRCKALDQGQLSVLQEVDHSRLHAHATTPKHSTGIVLSYDLPRFSEGDESQLSKRFRSLVDGLRAIGANNSAFREAAIFFCPGGDGGILVLCNIRTAAKELVTELGQRLTVESEYKASPIGVSAHLGVHYGVVSLYMDAAGRQRPTGPACFVAEDLISDSAGREVGIVFSGALRDVISHGSDTFLTERFEELPALQTGPAAGIPRYSPRAMSGAKWSHPLVEQLFNAAASWQIDPSAG